MKFAYTTKRIGAKNLAIIEQANDIMAEYAAAGYTLTLRQIYYQFVIRNLLVNDQKSYSRLGAVLSDGRMRGLIDWTLIEDRTRNLKGLPTWTDPGDMVLSAAYGYRIDKWLDQVNRVEVWIEKEALAGIFARVCNELQVNYFSCRGYVSQSEMWVASQRLRRYEKRGLETTILHFGDHDPSGIDMTRDIRDRLLTFGSTVRVERVALTMDQIREHAPPPNPAKLSDARARAYISQFGYSSWELDALEPDILSGLVRDRVLALRDDQTLALSQDREDEGRKLLRSVADNWTKVRNFARGGFK